MIDGFPRIGLLLLLATAGCGNPDAPTAPRVTSPAPAAPGGEPATSPEAGKDARGMQRVGGMDKP
jgi:hypothetical protein